MNSSIERKNPPTPTTTYISTMDRPRTPMKPGTETLDTTKITLVGSNPGGQQFFIKCTPELYAHVYGVDPGKRRRTQTSMHMQSERQRFLVRQNEAQQAFRIDTLPEYDASKLNRDGAAKDNVLVRILPDAAGTIQVKDYPGKVRYESVVRLVNLISTLPKLEVGETYGGRWTVDSIVGDTVYFMLPTEEEPTAA
jgi:hypothetical protein